jgi:hypothetical protein
MDWRDYPDETILEALDYTEPRLTCSLACRLADFPSPRGFLAARLEALAGRGLVTFTLRPRPGWLRVPSFIVQSEGDWI